MGKKAFLENEFDDKDFADCADVNDCGDGIPVYAKFQHEDWVLLNWKYELHLLAHGFKHDVEDPERPGLPEDHIAHYYKLYLGQQYNSQALGQKNLEGVVELLEGVVKLSGDSQKILEPVLGEDLELSRLVIMTEEERRNRVRRIEAGDESCILNIPKGEGRKGGAGKGGAGKSGGKASKRSSSPGAADGRPSKSARTGDPKPSRQDGGSKGGGAKGSRH